MKTKMAQPGMVFLTYKSVEEIDAIVDHYCEHHETENDFTDSQNVRHRLWKIENENIISKLIELFQDKVPASYIADGHHRSASSTRLAQWRRQQLESYTGNENFNYFLGIFFSEKQFSTIFYNFL